AAQIVMGASLGARFAGYSINQAKLAIRAAAVGVSIMLLIGISMSLALLPFVDETLTAMILAFAPGGLAEMSLIALSLQVGVAFVAAHHVIRISLTMILSPIAYRMFIDKDADLTR
ncbi:MAG: AbrB family transcriptional regulator, partial [Pseudomonadota bacterium]